MGCVTGEHPALPLYYLANPDGNCIEIAPNNANNLRQPGVDVLAALRRRRSVRRYTGEPIPAEKLGQCWRPAWRVLPVAPGVLGS